MNRFHDEPLEIDGKRYPVLRVTRRIRGKLKESAHLWRKERLRDNYSLAGAPPQVVADKLGEFDREAVSDDALIAYLNTEMGTDEAIVALLAECRTDDCPDADPAALAERIGDPVGFLVKYWPGLSPAPLDEPKKPDAAEGEVDPANPPSPPVFRPHRT